MLLKILAILFTVNYIETASVQRQLKPLVSSEKYTQSSVVDEDRPDQYVFFWKLTSKDEIQFEIHCRTTGWVGFGLTPNGGMTGADIAISWVDDVSRRAYLKDTHATGFSQPITDQSQDWFLIDAAQIDGYTIVKMKRKLNTCDLQHDIAIKAETNYMIVAWNNEDPINGNDGWQYHGPNKLSKVEFLLLFKNDTLSEDDEDIANAIVHEFRIPNIVLKNKVTFYYCQIFEQPQFPSDVHILRYDILLDKPNRDLVHHMDFFECPLDFQLETGLETGHECGSMPYHMRKCLEGQFMIAWSFGGYKNYTFPRNTGLPVHKSANKRYFIVQIHYENPKLLKNLRDSSGVKFFYTTKLRQYEVGILTVGSDSELTIPPQIEGLKIISNCYADCSNKFLPSQGITVFSGNLHTHLAGREVRTKLVRNNRVVRYLFDNPRYDFNYQFNIEIKPVQLHKGDVLVTECVFESKDRNVPTFWGIGTYDEMCFNFIYYYPRMSNYDQCYTKPTPKSLFDFYRGLAKDGLIQSIELDENHYGQSVKNIVSTLQTKTNYTNELKSRFIQYYNNVGSERLTCGEIELDKPFVDFPDDVASSLIDECKSPITTKLPNNLSFSVNKTITKPIYMILLSFMIIALLRF